MSTIPFSRRPLTLALLVAMPAFAAEQEHDSQGDSLLDSVVVTAPAMVDPLTVVTDPKAPRQPIPANDGADFLKSIPGFSVTRKGGTDGDPLLRGMSGSRLGIFLDGQEIYGGCGGRMDPPTAYVYPASYDRVTVVKGPQNVIYGAGTSAGAVLFERDPRRFDTAGWTLDGSLIGGSFGRNDQIVDFRGGTPDVQVRAGATRAHSDDYEDGDGTRIHSRYTRWSANAALAWTPDENTVLELSTVRSDGEAAYADRGMDGAKFARENFGLKFERRNLSPVVEKVWAQAYYNHIDHVMDNYSLRDQPKPNGYSVSNPDRFTSGIHAGVTLAPSEPLRLTVGADAKRDIHRVRATSGRASEDEAEGVLHGLQRREDMRFKQFGVFGEASYRYQDGGRTVAGLRIDDHSAKDERPCVSGVCVPSNPTQGKTDRATLTSGFARYEGMFDEGAGVWYAGLGHVERFPDYWERIRFGEDSLSSAFLTVDPEKTTQLDVGLNWSNADWSTAVSVFYGKVQDYILMKWTAPTQVRNIDATVMGAEIDVARRLTRNWKTTATLAWVRGENDTDDTALAQQPPLEARFSLEYDDGVFSFGNLLRIVADQDRYDVGYGNIVGQDIGRTPGFAVFSINAGWRPKKGVLISGGVDNLFDRTYAEHLSKSGASIPGYMPPSNTQINEPGRMFWVQARITLD